MTKPIKVTSLNKLDRLHALLFAILFAVLGYALLTISRAAPPPPTVYLTTASQTLGPNTTFFVEVYEDSGSTGINAVQANFSYPQTLVDFVSIDTSVGAFQIIPEAVGANGQVNIAAATQGGGAPLTGRRLIARVNFRTKSVNGSAAMAFTAGTLLLNATTSADLLPSLSATEGVTIGVDVAPPTVSLISPANGATVARQSGTQVTITANASDSSGIARVDIIRNGTLLTSLTAAPYTHVISSTTLPLGSNTFQARAVDAIGNEATTSNVIITVVDVTAPTVSLTQPTAGATVAGNVAISANATDETGGSGVSKVEFFINGSLANTDSTAPYSFTWQTTTVTDGQYALTARAYDFATPQNSSLSSPVSVTVDNSDRQPPTTPTNLRLTGRTTKTVSIAWNASTDNVGVTGYRVSRNGTVVTTTTSLAFTDTNLTPGTAYTYNVVAVDARTNTSTASANLNVTTIRQGDVNGDGSVGLLDLSLLLSYYNATTQSPSWPTAQLADFSGDGRVGLLDLSILLTNYGL